MYDKYCTKFILILFCVQLHLCFGVFIGSLFWCCFDWLKLQQQIFSAAVFFYNKLLHILPQISIIKKVIIISNIHN